MSKKIQISFVSLVLLLSVQVFPQRIVNHDYPRIFTLHWGGGGTSNWLKNFDLILGVDSDSLTFRKVKKENPDCYILSTTDWNAGGPFRIWGNLDAIPAEWRLRKSDGSYIKVYGSDYFVDPTDYCGLYNGERYNQALPRRFIERTDWTIFDGLSSDGSWPFPYNTGGDIDLDRNGINDYTEHGTNWIREKWQTGQNNIRKNLRSLFKAKWGNPDEKLIFYWTMTDTMGVRVCNGGGWENMYINSPKKFSDWLPLINQWDSIGPAPRINCISADLVFDSANAPARHKDHFRYLRWALCTALLHDSYFMSGDISDHHWTNYYDEYDVKLGYPTGRAQKLSNGCWVRFFDNGLSIVNPTNITQTVTGTDLEALSGYAGPYYRFRGNQDPTVNDGGLFTSVTLTSTRASYSGSSQYVGDGIILVKSPVTVVADIIIDNAYSGTSPGSPPASLLGFNWDQEAKTNNPTWFTTMQVKIYNSDYYTTYYAAAGDGSAKAVINPSINVSGSYKVYEWHGWHGRYATSYREGSQIPCTIVHAGAQTNLTYDQGANPGQWNYLGTYTFTAGASNSLTITDKADGYVLADAFKFEFVNADGNPPLVPDPETPINGGINLTEPPVLKWKTSPTASSYHLQLAVDSLFHNLVISDSSIIGTSVILKVFSEGTTYYWRVRAKNTWGASGWSAVWHYSTITTQPIEPMLVAPVDGSLVLHTSLALSWNPCANASRYHIQLASDSQFSALLLDDTSVVLTIVSTPQLNTSATYYWHVRAFYFSGYGPYSSTYKFTTSSEVATVNFDRVVIDFGKVAIGTTSTDSFVMRNRGTSILKVRGIASSIPEYHVDPGMADIAPNESKIVHVAFSPTSKSVYKGYIKLEDTSSQFCDTIQIFGRGANPPKLGRVPRTITIKSITPGEVRIDSFSILNEGDLDLRITNISTTNSVFQITPESATIGSYDSVVFYLHTQSAGVEPQSGYIIITSNANPSPESLKVEIMSVTDGNEGSTVPAEFTISDNYPNPFNPLTTISYQVPVDSRVEIKIYNILGHEVRELANETKPSGTYTCQWDAKDRNGNLVPSGVYFYRFFASGINTRQNFTQMKKMILLK